MAKFAVSMNNDAVQDWLRVRRQLLDKESDFTTLAIKVANGEESEELLQQQRAALEGMRADCSAAYQRAFPSRTN
jgi:hypothetical protein